jgi:serine/threonine protein kinase
MNELLKPGQTAQGQHTGQSCRVEKSLGGGGQGEVYKAEWAGGPFALKWYFQHTATSEQLAALEKLVQTPPPSDKFLWPLDIMRASGVPGFGYIMRLRDARYKSLVDLMRGRTDPSFRALVTAGLELVDSFYKLHAAGFCYRDISFGNAFFAPDDGAILVCDNDNVAPNRTASGGVLGTPDFMAPEIVRGEAMPSRQTDLFSLAVLLFYMYYLGHPLSGRKVLSIRCWDLPARTKLYGTEPLFIFDPLDRSNEAVDRSVDPSGEAGANPLEYWRIYPQYLRHTFTKAFTTGIKDPEHGRVMEGEWRAVLSQLRDGIFYCSSCGAQNFYDSEAVKASGGKPALCWSCKKEPRLPFRIRIGKTIVMLNHDSVLHPHHLNDQSDFDFSQTVAQVAQHPTNPDVWGLKNLTNEKWVVTAVDGTMKDVEPGRSAVLTASAKINFGKCVGEIRY